MNSSTNSTPKSNVSYKTIIIVIIVIYAILLFLNRKMKFLPQWMDLLALTGIAKNESGKYWDEPAALTALQLKQNDLPGDFPRRFNYSIMFDLVIYDSRVSPLVAMNAASLPYRHILHRGSSDLSKTGIPNKGCMNSPSSATGDGLPQFMNPGFFCDPMKNDIIVFIDTIVGSNPLRESVRIPNIPLETPQRICVIVYENFMEVYKGCKLIMTKTLTGTPRLTDPEIYGLTGSAALNAKVMNLRLWSNPLKVQTIVSECNAPFPDFGIAPMCGSSGIHPSMFVTAEEQAEKDKKIGEPSKLIELNNTDKC
jgi:hypothetical protein